MTAVPARTAGVVSRMIAGVVDVAVAAGIVVGSYFAVTFFLFVVGWRLSLIHISEPTRPY